MAILTKRTIFVSFFMSRNSERIPRSLLQGNLQFEWRLSICNLQNLFQFSLKIFSRNYRMLKIARVGF